MTDASKKWWDRIKATPGLIDAWLIKQYRGEATAGARIRELAERAPDERSKWVLGIIAMQEDTHARWVLGLLKARGVNPTFDRAEAESRYWKEPLQAAEVSFDHGAAIGAHAEAMRLDRIRTIVNDEESPDDIREVFAKILPQEEFHERTFRSMASEAALVATLGAHREGARLLGLEA